MIITESILNNKRKDEVIAIALDLDNKLASLSGSPLSSSQIESMMLNLKKQATSVELNSQLSAEAHAEKLVELENEHDKAITKLRLEYDERKDVEAKEVLNLYKSLKDKVLQAKGDLSFGLKDEEIKIKEKLDLILKESNEKIEKALNEVEEGEEALNEFKVELKSQIDKLKENHERTIEQQTYTNKIAVRDGNLEVLKKVAEDSDYTLIETDIFEDIRSRSEIKDEEFKESINLAVTAAKTSIYASETTKYKSLENSSSSTIGLLENDKKHLISQIEYQNSRITDLESRLKEVPTQIKDAVSAAKADVVTNVDTGKK